MIARARVAFTAVVFAAVLAMRPYAGAGPLPHLRGIGEIRDWFNASQGHVRLILLLSPT